MSTHSLSRRVRVAALSSTLLLSGYALLDTTTAGAAPRQPEPPEYVVGPEGAAPATATVDPNLPADDPARGVIRKGLAIGKGTCLGLLEAVMPDGSSQCTHGPDAAPKGVDVRKARSVEDIAMTTKSSSQLAGTVAAGVPCFGDGTSGNRVQAIYARSSDVPDRYASLAGLFPQWAANADAVFNQSAAQTGGIRHLRWVTDAGCNLSVVRVTLSPTGDDNMTNTELELQSLGFGASDRKYMVWVDANVYCGIGDIRRDDRPGAENINNSGRSWARVDSGCWGYYDSPEAHEIMHMMGGVQPSAPHGSYAWHCTDESDRMCYSDGPGVVVTNTCPGSNEMYFDCNHDDYYSTNATPTSYLGTHWNAANNVFLETSDPAGTTTTTTAPPSTTTTTVAAATTVTSTWTGLFKGNASSATYSVTSGAGTMVASATYTGGGPSVTIKVTTAAGAIVAQNSGPSGVSLSVPVSAGSYKVIISGSKNTSYSLVDTRPSP
jgi:hypothetical protein